MQVGVAKRPDIAAPLVIDFAKNDLDRKALELIFARQLFAYPFAAPPKTGAAHAKALREAFASTTRDAAFAAEAKKVGVDIEPVSGEDIQKTIEQMYRAPADVIERAKFATRIENCRGCDRRLRRSLRAPEPIGEHRLAGSSRRPAARKPLVKSAGDFFPVLSDRRVSIRPWRVQTGKE